MKKIPVLFLLMIIILSFSSCDPSAVSDVKDGTWKSEDGNIWIDFEHDYNQIYPDGYIMIANEKYFVSLGSQPGSQFIKTFYLLKYEDGNYEYVDADNYVLKAKFSLDKTEQILTLQILENNTNDDDYAVDKTIDLYPC